MEIKGLEVVDYLPDSYGQSIGFLIGDLIVSVNKESVSTVDELKEKLNATAWHTNSHNEVTYKIIRSSKEALITAKPSSLGLLLQPKVDCSRQAVSANKSTYKSDYAVARNVANFISLLGWLTFIAGIIIAFNGNPHQFGDTKGAFLLSLLPGFGVAVAGVFLVAAGQVTRATVDNADHTREILRVLNEKLKSNL